MMTHDKCDFKRTAVHTYGCIAGSLQIEVQTVTARFGRREVGPVGSILVVCNCHWNIWRREHEKEKEIK
jgi:hypothetical protein